MRAKIVLVVAVAAVVVAAGNHFRLKLPKFRGICYSRNMNKKILLAIIIAIVLIGIASFIFWKYRTPQANGIIYFYGEGCPHCANVDQFLKDNKIEEKVSFEKKEVFNNQDNAKELVDLSQKCGLPSDQVGVPFLWDGSKCYVGDTDVINFFKQKTGIQ